MLGCRVYSGGKAYIEGIRDVRAVCRGGEKAMCWQGCV